MAPRYVGRFAPSPTGPLHAGSLVAALASWLDARAHDGRWLVRIEDVDVPRTVAGASEAILKQLDDCGLVPDETPWFQSTRSPRYQAVLDELVDRSLAYPCHCSRKDIEAAWAARGHVKPRHGELVYPGTCRQGMAPAKDGQDGQGTAAPTNRHLAWRLRVEPGLVCWTDRRLGPQQQNVAQEVGDFVLKRADGWFAYQLAVVVDDGDQGVTHVVRGEDLVDNTARQWLLQGQLGLEHPAYLHTPLVRDAQGEKLSKQSGARAVDTTDPCAALDTAATLLDLRPPATRHLPSWLAAAALQWKDRWPPR